MSKFTISFSLGRALVRLKIFLRIQIDLDIALCRIHAPFHLPRHLDILFQTSILFVRFLQFFHRGIRLRSTFRQANLLFLFRVLVRCRIFLYIFAHLLTALYLRHLAFRFSMFLHSTLL